MGKKTLIGWTHHTLNFWWGCTKVSAECVFCYIAGIMLRAGRIPFGGPIRTAESTWNAAYKWDREAREDGVRRRAFTCSMSDYFHPGADAWRPEAWRVIKECDQLDWLILTKRPELIADRLPPDWGDTGYPNVWLGTTVGIASSLHRVDYLAQIPAVIRFISAEPLLGPVDFRPWLQRGQLGWIISGCESAAKGKRRVMDMAWVRDIDAQCREYGVAHYLKQYYADEQGVPVFDGLLDGEVRQAFPADRHGDHAKNRELRDVLSLVK